MIKDYEQILKDRIDFFKIFGLVTGFFSVILCLLSMAFFILIGPALAFVALFLGSIINTRSNETRLLMVRLSERGSYY